MRMNLEKRGQTAGGSATAVAPSPLSVLFCEGAAVWPRPPITRYLALIFILRFFFFLASFFSFLARPLVLIKNEGTAAFDGRRRFLSDAHTPAN